MPTSSRSSFAWRPLAAAGATTVLLAAGVLGWRVYQSGAANDTSTGQTSIQEVSTGNLRISLLSSTGPLKQGRNLYTIEFRGPDGTLVDVGNVRATANMPMPGMVMPSGVQLQRTSVAGRYEATAEFGMAGAWQMSLEWDGPAGRGSVSFEGTVQ